MKKVTLVLTLCIPLLVFSQSVEREMVLMEIGTGTWCGWCPGAAVGADEMVENGHDVAVLENHNGDAYANTYSNGRNSYNGISGYPTAMFDGVEEEGGGAQCPNPVGKYDDYLPVYNLRKGIPSAFTLGMQGSNSGLDYNVDIEINKIGTASTNNVVIHVAINESHIQESWQGCMDELNFVNRLMVPGLNGTPLNLNGSTQNLSLSFSIDPTWVSENCEIICWLQDNTSKEVLQCIKSELDNLTPPPVAADFEADPTIVCAGSSVQFTDMSEGMVNSWSWTFPGGTPGSSTSPSPEVVYNTAGVYDVTLHVSDGYSSDEITKTAYILVSEAAPVTPGTPTGLTALCKNPENGTYSTSGSPEAAYYEWELNPTVSGFIMGDGATVTINWINSFVGDAYLKVKAINGCGESEFSDSLLVTVSELPAAFNLMGGGSFCEGDEGVEITQDGSEAGVDYELWKDGEPTAIIVEGTGEAITFGIIADAGEYVSLGTSPVTTCSIEMNNTAVVSPIALPMVYTATGGGEFCDGSEGVEIGLDGSQEGCTYEIYLDDVATGETIVGDGNPVSFGFHNTEGTYTIMGQESEMGCAAMMEGDATATAIFMPEVPATPEGPETVDVYYNPVTQYLTAGSANSTSYQWTVEPANAGELEAISLNEMEMTWNDDFLGYANISVKGINQCGESVYSETLAVNIYNTVGIGIMDNEGISILPNPNNGSFKLKLNANSIISIKIYNTLNEIVYEEANVNVNGELTKEIRLDELGEGLYIMAISGDNYNATHKIIIRK